MASKAINVVLSLKDKLTGPMKKCSVATKEMDRQLKKTQYNITKFGREANKSFLNVASKATKAAGALAALGAGTGLNEALSLEGYKTQLETATKDTEKAAKIMKYAIDLANKTPFEGGQLVEAAAKFEAMGMSAEKWLTITGDMAAATNKDFDQATEALIDAQTGELERLKEFGITKAMITKKANEMFTDEVVNNQGQIVDMVKFNEALVALMEDKYSGGMDKLAKTVKGRWSTVTGVTKSALANLMGVSTDGSVRAGSALDLIGQAVQRLADKFQEWQENGTLDAIALKVDSFIGKVAGIAPMLSSLLPVLAGVGAGFAVFNILSPIIGLFTTLAGAVKGATTIMAALNAVMLMNPAAAVAVGIGLLVAAFTLAYTKCKPFHDLVSTLISKLGSLASKAKSAGSIIGGAFKAFSPFASRGFATGTSYAPGGLATINEGGRGEIVNLPSGAQVIPHDVAKKSVGSNQTVNVNVNIAGNIIGNREYVDYMGGQIVARLQTAMANS